MAAPKTKTGSTSKSETKHNELKPLCDVLSPGKQGDTEFEQIIAVMMCKHCQGKAPKQLTSWLWISDETMYLCCNPSYTANAREMYLNETLEELNKLEKKHKPDSFIIASSEDAPWIRRHFARVQKKLPGNVTTTHWDGNKLRDFLIDVPPLCMRYYPMLIENGQARLEAVEKARKLYNKELIKLHSSIQFVGMSVYKEEAAAGVDIDKIYIPLTVIPEGVDDSKASHTDPVSLLKRGQQHVILGDPGSGKSTLLRFLALTGIYPKLKKRYKTRKDERLPILVRFRRYADALGADPALSLTDYIIETAQKDFELPELSREFFEYYLYAGQSTILFDGIDELPDAKIKLKVRNQIAEMLNQYPNNTMIVTSRIVGYDKETRYDELDFSHHLISRLRLSDIERFVHDWYGARIKNKREQKLHADDLVRILSAPDSRAIRELAENPLLLTIICLVHRIDAVLPDERVVLYQKCTETLLNTWHAWRTRTEHRPRHNKDERRNRARMETIAYWMHCLIDGKEEKLRTVVSFEDITNFLTEYIEKMERPRRGKPHLLAEEFLGFVKDEAGLLIEVGEGQYSFVHLTFQEYLAATHLRKSGEMGGMEVVWTFIENRCQDSRWHEVIRLLTGALERTDAQAFLLERILPRMNDADYMERAILAGGCLLDGIDAAEEMAEDIVFSLLVASARVAAPDSLRNILRSIRNWKERDEENRQKLIELARQVYDELGQDSFQVNLLLNMAGLEMSDAEIKQISGRLYEGNDFLCWLFSTCVEKNESIIPYELSRETELFLDMYAKALSLKSTYGNFLLVLLTGMLPTGNDSVSSFERLLASMIIANGPFIFQLIFTILCRDSQTDKKLKLEDVDIQLGSHDKISLAARYRALDRALALNLDLALYLARVQALARDLDWALNLAQAQARNRARNLARNRARALDLAWDMARDLYMVWDLDRARDLAIAQDKINFWDQVIQDPKLHGPVLDQFCTLLDLSTQWREALRIRSLPRVPDRITLTDPQIWEQTEQSFVNGNAQKTDYQHAACQLLLDVWLWITEVHDNEEESPFKRLANLTRDTNSPYLRIAHCIRDIAYGDKSKIKVLKKMVQSKDPEYRKIFENALWRLTAEEKKKESKRKK